MAKFGKHPNMSRSEQSYILTSEMDGRMDFLPYVENDPFI